MRKIIYLILFMSTILIGCQDATSDMVDESAKYTLPIIISEFGEITSEEKIYFKQGQTVIEVLEDNFEIQLSFDGVIREFNGKQAKSEEYWAYFINDKMMYNSPKENRLYEGDKLIVELQNW